MAYRQFTRCIQPTEYKPRSVWVITLQSLALAPFATVLALGMAKPWCLLIMLEISPLAFLIAWCRYFLYHRLICLGGDRDVIGAIVSIEQRSFTDLDWDNDYSINLLLENTEFGDTQQVAEVTQPYGYLIAPQSVITNPPVSRATPGNPANDKFGTKLNCATLHAEFEGAGMYDLLQISQAMLGIAVAALLACIFLPFPADVIVTAGLAILAALGWLLGAILAKTVRQGDPSDVDPGIGTLHVNDNAGENGLGRGADIVYVQGTWVYDPLHDGWNEIHPIKVCTKVGTWDGGWPEQPSDVVFRARHAFEVARAEETLANQTRPEHQWQVHPDLDGCAPAVVE